VINGIVGEATEMNGRAYIRTKPGAFGHSIYGPYEPLGEGGYVVEYAIKIAPGHEAPAGTLCAIVDVAQNLSHVLARVFVFEEDIREDRPFEIYFNADHNLENVEYRVYVNGVVPLLIADRPNVRKLVEPAAKYEPTTSSAFFNANSERASAPFYHGIGIRITGPDIIFTTSGVSFLGRCVDDLNFIGEIFSNNTYNILLPGSSCLIDVGMNIGLTSLRLSTYSTIEEIHAFEPFKSTFDRAAANVALNPASAAKIHMRNVGLLDKDGEIEVRVNSQDSGSNSVWASGDGEAVRVTVLDAATTLRPIIDAAKAKGLLVVMKVDCEGAEFAIFKSLRAAGLLEQISAFMVELHAGWGAAAEVTGPLTEAGFSVIDLTPRIGNGMFYAVKTSM
jgi:FkbM family methyltransferase